MMKQKLLFTFALLLTAVTGAWADGSCGGGLTWTLSSGTLTISKTGEGDGVMTGYDWDGQPWSSQKDAITSVVIGDGVTGIGKYAFHECSNLASVTIGNSLQTIGEWAFKNCSMASITLPATMTSIGPDAFYGCSNLSTVIIKATSLTGGYGVDAFVGNKSGRKIYVPANSANTYKAGWPAYANDIIGCGTCGATGHEWDVIWTLTGESPNCTLNIMKVGETGAMANYDNGDAKPWNGNRTNIKTIIVGDGVTHIGDHAFDYCAQTSLTIGSDVTTIGDCAFHNCGNITSIVIPNSVETIGESAFEFLSSLTNVTIGSGLKSIGAKGFHYNSQLSSVVIRAASLTSYGEVFNAGKNGRKIYVPAASVNTYKAGWTTYANDIIGYNGTCGATGHEWDVVWAVTGESPNKTLFVCGTGAMADYDWNTMPWSSQKDAITSVVIGDGVTGIGKYAFYEHSHLASVTIGNSLETIGVWAFKNCSMTSVTFPASVKSIGNSSFSECNSLTSVTLNSNPQIQANAFPVTATVTMNLTANPVGDDKWMTFFNDGYHFKAGENTTVYKGTLSGSSIVLKPVEDKIVTAGTAVILKSTGNPVMTLNSAASSDTNSNSLQGVSDLAGKTAANPSTTYVLNYKEGTGVGFYKLKSGKTLGYGKAYLDTSTTGAPSYLNFEENETTEVREVKEVNVVIEVNDNSWYTLDGRKMDSKPTAKGLYIVNGKKVVIK